MLWNEEKWRRGERIGRFRDRLKGSNEIGWLRVGLVENITAKKRIKRDKWH